MGIGGTTVLPQPKSAIANVPFVTHGAADPAELEAWGLDPEEVVDFSVNDNPYGPSPAVTRALASVPAHRYPDREARALRRALSARLGVGPERIVAGNGASELLWLVALGYIRSRDTVMIVGPTFGEYERVARLMGARVQFWRARAETGFAVDPDGVAAVLDTVRPAVVFLCTPNNPTGTLVPTDVIARWARAHPACLFVVDESYFEFAAYRLAGLRSAIELDLDNILVIRSLTKLYGLAGLRLGYAVAPPQVVAVLHRVAPPWHVNAVAQAAGVAALTDEAHVGRSLARVWDACDKFRRGLETLGLTPLPSATHFFLLDVGDGAAWRRRLLRYGLVVRDCASFGLPQYIRLATRREEENERLLATLARERRRAT